MRRRRTARSRFGLILLCVTASGCGLVSPQDSNIHKDVVTTVTPPPLPGRQPSDTPEVGGQPGVVTGSTPPGPPSIAPGVAPGPQPPSSLAPVDGLGDAYQRLVRTTCAKANADARQHRSAVITVRVVQEQFDRRRQLVMTLRALPGPVAERTAVTALLLQPAQQLLTEAEPLIIAYVRAERSGKQTSDGSDLRMRLEKLQGQNARLSERLKQEGFDACLLSGS